MHDGPHFPFDFPLHHPIIIQCYSIASVFGAPPIPLACRPSLSLRPSLMGYITLFIFSDFIQSSSRP